MQEDRSFAKPVLDPSLRVRAPLAQSPVVQKCFDKHGGQPYIFTAGAVNI